MLILFLFSLWGCYVGPIWDPSGQPAYGITHMEPMRSMVALPWVFTTHMGPIYAYLLGTTSDGRMDV